jgi:recombinational DNA repair protein (RecF pathway)
MYQKYQTDALVLKSYEQGEADKVFAVYTRDFGLIRARASAVRTEKSKMRYALQNYARANVGLVRGKRGWRMAGASAVQSAFCNMASLSAFARISELVLRLVQGEEQNEYLFAAISEAHDALLRENGALWSTIEIVCVARVLYALGYLSAEALETTLFTHTTYSAPYLEEAHSLYDQLLSSVNKAIAETQL